MTELLYGSFVDVHAARETVLRSIRHVEPENTDMVKRGEVVDVLPLGD